jgi:predicted anti-sigma-YlaC factor YlaD
VKTRLLTLENMKPRRRAARAAALGAVLFGLLLGNGCSVRKFAVNQLGNALAGSGATYASDDDPELVRDAAPFSLKLIETVLAETPRHRGLLLGAASGFTQYAYVFVQEDADELEAKDLEAAQRLRERARRLYLRARNYGLRGLDTALPGFETALRQNPKAAARRAGRADVPLLYWTAAAWGSAISLSKDNPDLVAEVPCVEALIDRAAELDPDFDHGALHSFLITYEMARSGVPGDPAARARQHFERALELSQGRQAGPMVALAEAVCVQKQNLKEFESLLNRALAVDVNAKSEWRLMNLVMQRRARWLLARKDDLFLVPEK